MPLKDRYINPFTDFGFKKLFGTEPNKDLLINFLNEVILPPTQRVADLSYRSTVHMGQTELDRKAIFDLYCISSDGERFIVEMQKAKQNYFKDRSVFYATFPIQEQAQTGDWNYQLAAIYTVGILDFVFSEEEGGSRSSKEVRHEVKLKDQRCEVFYDKLTFIYLEMPHFTKTLPELETIYDKWLYVLKHLPTLTERPAALQERVFKRLFEAAEIARFTSEEKGLYEASLKSYRDLKNVIDTAFDEGKMEGLIEGETKGKIEGMIEGEAKGKIEGMIEGEAKGKIEMALNLIKKGLSIELIGEVTGLSSQEIKKLQNDLE